MAAFKINNVPTLVEAREAATALRQAGGAHLVTLAEYMLGNAVSVRDAISPEHLGGLVGKSQAGRARQAYSIVRETVPATYKDADTFAAAVAVVASDLGNVKGLSGDTLAAVIAAVKSGRGAFLARWEKALTTVKVADKPKDKDGDKDGDKGDDKGDTAATADAGAPMSLGESITAMVNAWNQASADQRALYAPQVADLVALLSE